MAHYAKHLSFLLLIVLSLEHIDARESRFFSKVTHSSNKIVPVSESPLLAPTPAPAPAPASPAPAPIITENGYGLYGHGSTETTTTPTTTNTFANDENEVPAEELNNLESFKESNTGYSYNNNYNTNGYSNYNNNNNGYTTNSYGNNGYQSSEKQGMSDTRYVENGKYYYDVQNEKYYQNGYETSVKGSGNNNNNEGYNYGTNGVNSNEFNTMEEYERQQGYPESQGEFFP
ncbi:protein E6-like [Cornus florida]|uniref:protein E6-like n=1 Tax=Cornus florida TaxID=4283 RepID=UPI00289F336F|nr:protein E6-like [Cornus florida]